MYAPVPATRPRSIRAALAPLLLAAGIGFIARPAGAAATADPRLVPLSFASVRAGQVLTLRWSGGERAVEELELQLSLDGGRTFPVRVSPELDPRAGEFAWRVPNLATGEARLRLRFSRGGREISGDPTAAFRIERAAALEVERDPVHEGMWWTGEREPDVPGAGAALDQPSERLEAGAMTPSSAIGARDSAPLRRASNGARIWSGNSAGEIPSPPSRDASPRDIPRRN